MSTVPEKKIERVQFYENRTALFTENATVIGVSTSDCTSLSTKTAAARALYNAVDAMSVQRTGLIK